MSMNFIQSQRQVQKVSPRLIESVEILQMNSQELLSYIYDETVENPLIDMDALNVNDMRARLDWLSRSPRPLRQAEAEDGEDGPSDYPPEPAAGNTLREHLAIELAAMRLDRDSERICRYLLQAVDSRGYLDEEPGEVAELLGVSEAQADRCLKIMRSLSPAGVCAKDLQHCLVTQLKLAGGDAIAEKIAENHLERLAKGHYAYIAGALGCSQNEVKLAARKIKTLSPIPAAEFSGEEATEYSVPDAMLSEDENGDVSVSLLNSWSPVLRLSSFYGNLYKTSSDAELKDYLDKKLRAAKALIDGVSMREKTMLSCLNAVLDIQKDYLLGRKNSLRPMTLQDVADITGLSQATVSRALRGKSLQCRRGIVSLRSLFSTRLGEGGAEFSSDAAMEKIRELVEGEDKQKPLSDSALAAALAAGGIEISRRTVAKYREKMEIPGTFARKEAGNSAKKI